MLIPTWSAPKNIQAFTVLREDPPFEIPFPITQVHAAGVLRLPEEAAPRVEADAVFTTTPDTICAVRTADCLPILVSNTQGTEVAAIHAGWKGLLAGVIEATFARLNSAPRDCIVWIGPAICCHCFEVGTEVPAAFIAKNSAFERAFVKAQGEKWLGNLSLIAEMILHNLGITAISQSGICTIEEPRCDSFRREKGSAERMVTWISFGG